MSQTPLPLESASDPRAVGGKAYNLGRIARLGLPVPAGFALPRSAFDAFIRQDRRLRRRLERLEEEAVGLDPAGLAALADRIQGLFAELPLPKSVLQPLLAQRRALLSDVPLAVRSSAAGEDSGQASFAGQLDSFLAIASDDELADAVRRCWLSRWSPRVLAYQRDSGARLGSMGVVVQALVISRVSGVLFTEAPEGVTPNQLLTEYCLGSCEALVSGAITPGRFTISRQDLSCQLQATPEDGETELPLTDHQVAALGRAALTLEEAFGTPQDIEWTFDDEGQLWILQARPITTSGAGRSVIWSNANVNENFPTPITPLLHSIVATGYHHYFRNLALAFGISRRRVKTMEAPLQDIVGTHGARLYYNVTNIHAFLRIAPFGDLLANWFNSFVGVAEDTRSHPDDSTWRRASRGRFTEAVEVARIATHTTWQYLSLSRRVARFESTVDAFAARWCQLDDRALPELIEALGGFIEIRSHRWKDASLADTAAMVCCGALSAFLERAFPADDPATLQSKLLKGLPNIVSSLPPVHLWSLSRRIRSDADLLALFDSPNPVAILTTLRAEARFRDFCEAFEDFLKQWGFRCSGELMLTRPNLQEDPTALIGVLRSYASMDGGSPQEAIQQQGSERIAETARLRRRLPRAKRPLFSRLVSSTHLSLSMRERARLKQALLYSRCRAIALAIGGHLHDEGKIERSNDVFLFTWQELVATADSNPLPDHAELARRRNRHAEESSWDPPDSIVLPEGASWSPTPTGSAATDDPSNDDKRLSGLGAAGGRAQGRATVAEGVSDFHRIEAGDILVAGQTDPGWAPVFFLIRGLVLERGGLLSHGAIIAREFGIPSVVDVRRATERIPSGSKVVVNGDDGLVHVLD